MALGLPDKPPDDIIVSFQESHDDETCPECGWDREEAALDPQAAFNAGVLLAVEFEDIPFAAMQGATQAAYYWRCAGEGAPGTRCDNLFTTEEEISGAGTAA